jgi:colicin import membrane protein
MSENQITIPVEILEISQQVNENKQVEVSTILNEIFTQVKTWEAEIATISVTSIDDKTQMKKANELRIKVKNARLNAEKQFDQKRSDVKALMIDYQTEDSMWLKAKQIMQIKTKAIEEKAEWQEKFAERFEREQKELKTQLRLSQIQQYKPETTANQVSDLTDEFFNTLLNGAKTEFEERIKAKEEAEKQALEAEKQRQIEAENLRLENEKLKAEAEKTRLENEAKAKIEAEEKAKLQAEVKKAEEKAMSDLVISQRELANTLRANEEAEKARKNQAYKNWLSDNMYNPKQDEVINLGNGVFKLVREISKIVIK